MCVCSLIWHLLRYCLDFKDWVWSQSLTTDGTLQVSRHSSRRTAQNVESLKDRLKFSTFRMFIVEGMYHKLYRTVSQICTFKIFLTPTYWNTQCLTLFCLIFGKRTVCAKCAELCGASKEPELISNSFEVKPVWCLLYWEITWRCGGLANICSKLL